MRTLSHWVLAGLVTGACFGIAEIVGTAILDRRKVSNLSDEAIKLNGTGTMSLRENIVSG